MREAASEWNTVNRSTEVLDSERTSRETNQNHSQGEWSGIRGDLVPRLSRTSEGKNVLVLDITMYHYGSGIVT